MAKYQGKFNQQREGHGVAPKQEKTSFADLDLGLDIDLSFLDEIEEPAQKPAAPAKKPAPARKSAPQQGAPVRKSAAPQQGSPAKKAAPAQQGAPAKKPAAQQAAPAKKAAAPAKKPSAPQAEPVKQKKQKKGPRLGSVIFYTLYFMFILAFFLATYIGLNFVNNWLTDFEMAQPTYKAEQVFTQLFTSPDWGALYESAGARDSLYEGKDEYVTYMQDKVGSTKLTYMETSAGLSGNKKYVVRLNDEKVATFTLVDKNKVGDLSLDNLENIADIPDWQLGSVEVFFEREGSYRIEKVDGHTVYVNDVALDDSYTIQIATTLAEKYLPEGTTGASMCLQQVTGLMELPTVVILDEEGNPAEVTYDEATRTFTERTESNTMAEDQKTVALDASKTYALWMIEEVTDRAKIAKYFDTGSQPYSDITRLGELWMQGHAGYVFQNEAVSKFASYGEDLFSIYVSMDLVVTRKDGSERTYDFDKTLFFKKINGSWKVIDWTNEDVSQPVGKVRLTFMDEKGTTQLTSDFYTTDAKQVITPIIQAPAGKVLSGWVRQDIADDGTTTLTVVFEPDETGRVAIAEGTTLEPLTLYPLFESADAADITAEEVTEGA